MHVLTSKKLSATKRLELVKEKRLCFSCLKPARHSMRQCRIEKICNIDGCTFKHSRFLHAGFQEAQATRDQNDDDDTQSTGADATQRANENGSSSVSAHTLAAMNTTTYFGKTALPVVRITVTATNGRSTQVYALLDTGSDRTFCSPRLLDDLGIKG